MPAGVLAWARIGGACASAPPVAPKGPTITPDQKMSWILRLEDQRILRAPAAPPVVAAPLPQNQKKKRNAEPPPAPVVTPDLTALATDPDPRVRRRAAPAIGRVGLPEAVPHLHPPLSGTPPHVRHMAP